MKRIVLSQREKHVLRGLANRGTEALSEFDTPSVGELERLGLVKAMWLEGHTLDSARLTNFGKEYLLDNPRLRDPFPWERVGAVAAIITAVSTTVSLILHMLLP